MRRRWYPLSASPAMRARTVYFVPERQADDYRQALAGASVVLPGLECARVVGLPEEEVSGIAQTRQAIGRYADAMGEGKFLMSDDDVKFHVRLSPSVWNLRLCDPADADEMISRVEGLLEDHAHVGVSPREGNNRWGVCPPDHVALNTRTLRVLAYQTDEFLRCEHGRVPVMEDFDVNLQLLRRGLSNASLVYWAQGQAQTGSPGGCSTYRDHATQDRAARRLAELHPGFVRVREKQNRSGGEFGHRTDVTIQWRQALESAA